MAQSSIHIEKVTTGSFLHNDRTMKPSYLIDDSALNECSRSSQESLDQYYKLKAEAEHNYTERTGQKMQKSTVLLKEAIVNLEAHHTLKDLQPIIKELEGYGFTVLQSAIHRDEGFLNDDSKEKNYHAHITMFNLDPETGKSVKLGKNYRQELSKLQTLTANVLGMERGKVSVEEEAKKLGVDVEKASKRLGTHTYKRAMVLKENATKELTQEIKAKDYSLKEMQNRIVALEGANTELRKELHAQNRDINKTQDLEAKERKITELEAKLTEIEGKNTDLSRNLEMVRSLRTDDKQKISELSQTVDTLQNDLKISQSELELSQKKQSELEISLKNLEDIPKKSIFFDEPVHEPINTSKIVELQDENKLLKVLNQGLEIELKEAKSATVPKEIKGENEASKEVEKQIEAIRVPYISVEGGVDHDDSALLKYRSALEEQAKKAHPKYFENMMDKHSNRFGILDREALAKQLATEKKEDYKTAALVYNIANELVKYKDKAKEVLKSVVESSKSGLESVFNKITGKSLSEIQKERTERQNDLKADLAKSLKSRSEQMADLVKTAEKSLFKKDEEKEPEQPKRSQGLTR